MFFKQLLKWYAPKAFNDGLHRCNQLGKKMVQAKSAERVLDVGCGDGKFTIDFFRTLDCGKIYGIEFVDELRKEAEQRSIGCIKQDLNTPWQFESDYFDIILSSQNIEHMHNTRLYLEECHRCLKPGGQIILLTENLSSWINIGALLFGWQPFSTTNIDGWSVGNPLVWHQDEPKEEMHIQTLRESGVVGTTGHVRIWSYCGLKDLLQKVGFQRINAKTAGYLPFWGILSHILCALDKRHGHFLAFTGFKS